MLSCWLVTATAAQTIADPSGVTIESCWQVGCARSGAATGDIAGNKGATEAEGEGAGWFTSVTAVRLVASRSPPANAGETSSSRTTTFTPGPATVQSKASVCPSAVQDSDLASSPAAPMVPSSLHVSTVPVASVYSLTSCRLRSFLKSFGSTAMASLPPSGESANPVIKAPLGTDMSSFFSGPGRPAALSRTM